MKHAMTSLKTELFAAEREWAADGIPVLIAHISLPEPSGTENRFTRRVRRYYRAQCRAYLRYCGRQLYPQALTAYRAALTASTPFSCFQAELTHHVTYNENGFWSLYTQTREPDPGGQTLLRRWGDTWDLRTGYPTAFSAFFPPHSSWKRQLTELAAAEIRRQEAAGQAQYLPGWQRKLRRYFDPRNFYLTGSGPVFFYPMFSIAPAAEGIPAFAIPWNTAALSVIRPDA